MIYTVGYRESYLEALKDENPLKIGPREAGVVTDEPYGGGIAFLTPEGARAYIEDGGERSEGYSVFSLDGEEEDTYEIEPGELRITRDLRILGEMTER